MADIERTKDVYVCKQCGSLNFRDAKTLGPWSNKTWTATCAANSVLCNVKDLAWNYPLGTASSGTKDTTGTTITLTQPLSTTVK